LALLVPGQRTPKSAEAKIEAASDASDPALAQYLEAMPEPEKQFTAFARQAWLTAPSIDVGPVESRNRLGIANAPVTIVEFTDIMCGHCKQLELTLAELRRVLPEGRLSIEARNFPLDGECNAKVQKVWGDGIRCLAAKAQICLENTPSFWAVKHELFDQQATLSKELILETATRQSGLSLQTLQACIADPKTQQKLDDDIAYASKFDISGTPLVLVNGRETPPSGAFLLALAINKGNVNAPFFLALPPPPPPQQTP
jgi:serine/threonine-protein kinase